MAYDPSKDRKIAEEKICDGKGGTELWGQVHKYNGGEPRIAISRWYGDDIKKLGRLSFEEAKAVVVWMEKIINDEAKYVNATPDMEIK